ncbi:MAG: 6-bladed beta-propeller [Bacteroidales bacterium]
MKNTILLPVNILFVICISCAFYGCKTATNDVPTLIQVNLATSSPYLLRDKFTLKQIVPLDTAALLNSDKINYITVFNNQLFVTCYEDPTIFVFNLKSGKLEYKIDRSGRGPEEYTNSPRIAMYSEETILIEDFAGAIKSYDLQGNYKQGTDSVITSNKLFSIINVNDSTFLISKELLGLYFHKDLSKPYYSVDLVNHKGKIIKKMVERDATLPKIPVRSAKNQFYKFKNRIYLCPLTENNIYNFDEKDSTLKCLYSIDINNSSVNNAFEEQRHTPAAIFFKKIYVLNIAAVTNRYFLISADRQKGESRYILIDRSNNSTTVYDRNTNEDMNLGRFIANDKGMAIQLVNYFDLIDDNGIVINTPLVDKIREYVKIDENMNPVLSIYSPK